MRRLLVLTILAACSDQPGDPAGRMCTKATYDPCTTEHDCTTGACHYFADNDLMVCTTHCLPGNSQGECPVDASGTKGTCMSIVGTDSGLCEPSAPNVCHL